MSILNKFEEASKVRKAINAIERKLTMLFSSVSKTTPKPQLPLQKDEGLGGELIMDTMVNPIFSALFGAGAWDIINTIQTALGTIGRESSQPAFAFAVAHNQASAAKARMQLGYYAA